MAPRSPQAPPADPHLTAGGPADPLLTAGGRADPHLTAGGRADPHLAAGGRPVQAAAPPPPAPRIAGLPAYRPGRSAADARADHGVVDAIKLASNELPWGPVPSVSDALRRQAAEVNRYPDHLARRLRMRLAAELGVPPSRVATGAGAVGLLNQLALAFVSPGDEVVRGEPSFEAYPIFTRLAGGTDVAVPNQDHRLDLDGMAAALTTRTKMVLVANPNNPTGTAVGLDAIADLAGSLPPRALLVVDEAYREFVTDTSAGSALSLAAERSNVVVLRTFSKAHGLAALRVGYAVAHPEVVEALDKVLIPFSVGALGQVAAVASLDAAAEVTSRVAAATAERRRLAAGVTAAGWEIPDPQANFIWLPAGAGAASLARELERSGVVVRPFAGAGVRVTVGTPTDNDRFLAALPPAER
ncbi:MAG TPA: histidinol-phosphate transaminase [Acidimicrobiales bacterium]|nr:histidinol-phosphate transaminase [Acidimicrobiales bacterium]